MGVVLVVAAIVALTGIRDYGDHVDLKVRSWLIIALIVLLLVRGLAFAPRTTGAPALVAGGLVGALAGLESGRARAMGLGGQVVAHPGHHRLRRHGGGRGAPLAPVAPAVHPGRRTVRRDRAAVTVAAPA